ncbi:flagellin-like protein [Methanofollis sp. W23]|uniref:type IV pilin n=1 Tax=Methanofollis sp. W23 TaxID=2817849 RepID=UPI001AE67818|nr:type IV pilin N-terminal domain-containing protein [Methanofollis sp. W23]MBP2145601.1 flagellin-like protein [Methanofollis sp. W23]
MNSQKEMHEEAVSPVIGVILMVAITVVLAAVVGMYVMGQADAIPESKSVTMTAEKSIVTDDSKEFTEIKVTVVGGSDLNALQSLTLKWDGKNTESLTYNGEGSAITTGVVDKDFAPGDVITIDYDGTNNKYGDSGKLTIAGKFSDGSEALLLTKNF